MTKLSPAFEGKANELARLGAAEGLAVNILVRPVLCPLDDRTAAFSALMGSFVGQSFATSSFSASGDEAPVGNIMDRMKEERFAYTPRCLVSWYKVRLPVYFMNVKEKLVK